MKHTLQAKANQNATAASQQNAADTNGAAITPPSYGMDFLDNQKQPNRTGLPDKLKTGIENLSGLSMDAVRVHYNSSKPAQLNALAYTQGIDIHVASGQEKHLPHEAWHVVQQAQGRVKPTMQAKGTAINDDAGLEAEADVMGERAVQIWERMESSNARPDPAAGPVGSINAIDSVFSAIAVTQLRQRDRKKKERERKAELHGRRKRFKEQFKKSKDPQGLLNELRKKYKGDDLAESNIANAWKDAYPSIKYRLMNMNEIDDETRKKYDELAIKDETSWGIRGHGLVISTEGEKGAYDEDFGESGIVMWRSDTRSPKEVLKTGFTTKAERDLGKGSGKHSNKIIYRTGTEDIVPATGVCVARDVRGACFFPFESKEVDEETKQEAAYLYAVRMRSAVSTFRAQKMAERLDSGNKDWHDPGRFKYDPEEKSTENASSVWPYAEYVTHRIEPEDVVGAYRFSRDKFIDSQSSESKAGMGFSINPKNLVPVKKQRKHPEKLINIADMTANAYSERYPSHPEHFLSYQGTIRRKKGKKKPTSESEAAEFGTQITPFPPSRIKINEKKEMRKKKLAEKKELKQRGKQRMNFHHVPHTLG